MMSKQNYLTRLDVAYGAGILESKWYFLLSPKTHYTFWAVYYNKKQQKV